MWDMYGMDAIHRIEGSIHLMEYRELECKRNAAVGGEYCAGSTHSRKCVLQGDGMVGIGVAAQNPQPQWLASTEPLFWMSKQPLAEVDTDQRV